MEGARVILNARSPRQGIQSSRTIGQPSDIGFGRPFVSTVMPEEKAIMSVQPVTPAAIKPHLERCGYTGSRLAPDYHFDDGTVPLAGFFGRPWDARSACLAVVETRGDGKTAAA